MMLKRIRKGFEFSEENLALDMISDIGPGGMFADSEHTLERMRTTMYLTDLADRDPRQQWLENGAQDTQARAMARVKEILTRDNPSVFSPDIDAQIQAHFIGMLSGESTPPQGWQKTQSPTQTGRETRDERRKRLRKQGSKS
jgi:trimethylamine--corrinoid protein Co-methyltransferase